MRAVDIIVKKRDGQELSREEISFFVDGFTHGSIPDYQASALAMAILLNGMTPRETAELTLAMVASGETIDLSKTVPIAVDKHSTGGVGDKTTLVVEPIVAAAGLAVGKMSGRGLGFSGGTIDKIESIPGFRTDLSIDEFLAQLSSIGLVLTGQTGELAPADGKLYALRDVTGTVQSIPLIASSVMSKKIAAGAAGIVLDVKVGSGAFMHTLEEAQDLAQTMVAIASSAGRKAVALLSDMNQPLGHAVGNSLEIREAIMALNGQGPTDLLEHCLTLAAKMLVLGEVAKDYESGRDMAAGAIENGEALDKFRQLVEAQGGAVALVDHPNLFPIPDFVREIFPPRAGYYRKVDARVVGETSVFLGAGRAVKSDVIDHAVGIEVHAKVGEPASIETPAFTVYANREDLLNQASDQLASSLEISESAVPRLPIFYGMVDESGVFLETIA
jgi:pyrimidine-nucleoside phosphorylase